MPHSDRLDVYFDRTDMTATLVVDEVMVAWGSTRLLFLDELTKEESRGLQLSDDERQYILDELGKIPGFEE